MNTLTPIYTVSLLGYTLDAKPDYETWGKRVDEVIEKNFLNKEIVIRALSLVDHPNVNMDSLVETIIKTGTDKYDPDRKNFWSAFDVYKGKNIDLFASKVNVGENFHFMHEVFGDFFEGAKEDRGYPVKLDLITIYDPSKLQNIPIQYSENDIGEDAWRFLARDKKPEALLGIIKIEV